MDDKVTEGALSTLCAVQGHRSRVGIIFRAHLDNRGRPCVRVCAGKPLRRRRSEKSGRIMTLEY